MKGPGSRRDPAHRVGWRRGAKRSGAFNNGPTPAQRRALQSGHVCVHGQTRVCTHTRVHTHAYTNSPDLRAHVRVQRTACMCGPLCTCVYTQRRMCTDAQAFIRVQTRVRTRRVYTHRRAQTRAHIHRTHTRLCVCGRSHFCKAYSPPAGCPSLTSLLFWERRSRSLSCDA